MLAGIIQTIIMALGIATGNISSNAYKGGNVFNNETKPAVKKALTTDVLPIYYYEIAEWHDTTAQDTSWQESRKYYISTTQNQQNPIGANLYLNNLTIYNSVYVLSFRDKTYTQYWNANTYHIYKITNYYNGGSEFDIATQVIYGTGAVNSNLAYGYVNYISNDATLDQAIDVTMNASSADTIINIVENSQKTQISSGNGPSQDTSASVWVDDAVTIGLSEGDTLYLIMRIYVQYIPNNINISPDTIIESGQITSIYTEPTYNYEVVDIPGIMFTVLTMPFSFISSAFNLTIFPGTPYQINFANLFMVVLATFILMWLIKKVFH